MMKQEIRSLAQSAWLFIVFIWNYCWDAPYLRFLNVGFLNLLFMFGSGVFLNFLLQNTLPTFFIGILVNIFYVTFSFGMKKVFIYKTKGDWLKEYLRCYAFYSVSIVISVFVLWILVDQFSFAFWSAQLIGLFVASLFYALTSRYFAFLHPSWQKEKVMVSNNKEKDRKQLYDAHDSLNIVRNHVDNENHEPASHGNQDMDDNAGSVSYGNQASDANRDTNDNSGNSNYSDGSDDKAVHNQTINSMSKEDRKKFKDIL